jgi:hypothetical protein
MNKLLLTILLSITVLVGLSAPGWSQATWEGPTGVFLNPLALTLPAGTSQASLHYLDLNPVGALTTEGVSFGFKGNWEAGITRDDLAVKGLTDLDLIHAKWVFLPAKNGAPSVAVGGIYRHTEGGSDTSDFYLAATEIVPGTTPVIASLTVRNTNGLGSGLFGEEGTRSTVLGGFLGVVPVKKLIVGVEYYAQPHAVAWEDVAARWNVDPNTNIDAGLAKITDTLDSQFAVGISHRW